ncbi:GNAT family N-acetyltransferase [Rossellomorea sp. SC111]|uniref:GNAT family N-acetyltransferase n=1 Tax=Rossellomorea sp. SC111 TaxID=2968985 RepID=UPI00215A71D4|nr:GNAT family N-acetyltransferase [Rossellomorea sp. SC111]MCR8847481.1 GNAT family N-acetyltransferase [Rossellomorea sp. SC111]
MKVTETTRLTLRWVEESDADFIMKLLNEPGWLQYIGDKGVHTLEDAIRYILTGPRAMYEREGFGLFLAERKDDRAPIGLCGLIKREGLEDVDIGFAFLSDYQSQGYAFEAASATVEFAKEQGIKRLVAITTKDNDSSSKLLEKLDMKFEGFVTLPNDTEELKKYGIKIEL